MSGKIDPLFAAQAPKQPESWAEVIPELAVHPIFAGILSAWQLPTDARQSAQAPVPQTLKDQDIPAGTSLAKRRDMKQRCYVTEYHGNNRATFECSTAGHLFKGQMFRKAPNGKYPAEVMIAKFARYWGRHNEGCSGGGVSMQCPKCKSNT